jgi:hypothetical protein
MMSPTDFEKSPAPLPWVSSCGGAGQSPARVHLRHAGLMSGDSSTRNGEGYIMVDPMSQGLLWRTC